MVTLGHLKPVWAVSERKGKRRRKKKQTGRGKKRRKEKKIYPVPRFGSYNLKSKDLKRVALKLFICYPETEN